MKQLSMLGEVRCSERFSIRFSRFQTERKDGEQKMSLAAVFLSTLTVQHEHGVRRIEKQLHE